MGLKQWTAAAVAVAGLVAFGAGGCRAQYGDVRGDGIVSVADVHRLLTYVQGRRYGGTTDQRILRYGDIDPVTSPTSFGDSAITMGDVARVLRRAAGLEADGPSPDFWPLNAPKSSGLSATRGDTYTYLDQWNDEATAIVGAPYTYNGYTVCPYKRTDGTEYDLYKDANGDIYFLRGAMALSAWMQPLTISFENPIPILYQKDTANGTKTTWSGQTIGDTAAYGPHPVKYTITVQRLESTSVPADGGLPFDGTLVLKMGFAFLSTPQSPMEAQQSWFFWLAPYVGPIQEGRASLETSTEPNLTTKPLWRATSMSVGSLHFP